ncbi:protein PML isoform X1 [Echinops telfairi]|uniref:Protein PML isoform X1 n=1 Tax=Echinops telfairi TaxID=9371 RepID=A0AC55CNI1_ECHTE|nr:protein PML isoform X1 [Echinops telfairi]
MLPAMIVSSPPDSRSEGHRSNPSPMEQSTEEEFQFLHCQRCKSEAKCPKLLPCLHTLCSKCQQESDLQCPICQAPCSHILDNIFFQNLQQNLSLYRQIRSPHAACTRCKESADFWCFECQQLLCAKCFEAHQWFVKHEAHPLADFESQPVHEFLERMRKFNIFCSNPRHKSPELTSIYCRGCAKPLCCSCALLDTGHSQDKRDICTEIQQRQEELDTMAQALQVQEGAFAEAHARMATITSQLDSIRKDTEKLIRSQVSEVVEQVLALERELLQSVEARFELDNQEIAKHLGHLDAVLQRIRTGGTLVQKMKGYASGQEVLDMHSFLCEALRCLSQEEPQSLKAPVSPHSFEEFKDEFKERLKTLVSSITWEMDEAQPKRANPEAASTPGDPFDVDLTAVVEQQAQEQALRQAEAQPMAVVQQEPGAHPVPLFAFSIKDPSLREEVSSSPTAPKRKSCQTESPRKVIKMESEEGKEVPPEQPRHRTSTAVSAPHSDGPSSPRSPTVEREVFLPNNHEADQPGEAEERVVVISSSEDSDAENSPSGELTDSSSESSDLQLEDPSSLSTRDETLSDSPADDSPLVFFDLKFDQETQKISQLAAVHQESKFRVLIEPEAVFSVYSKAVSLEVGLAHFLRFLGCMRRPILACYQLWAPALPNFFRALEDMNSLCEFRRAISGFLDIRPLLQERMPEASSFKLRKLARTYLVRNMNERSALATVLVMRDLCRLFDVHPGLPLVRHIYSVSSLQCFASLQPLVRVAVLPRASARLLALHSVGFQDLLATHRQDPQKGLQKYSRYLSLQATSTLLPAPPAFQLQPLHAYFAGLLAQEEGLPALPPKHSLPARVSPHC